MTTRRMLLGVGAAILALLLIAIFVGAIMWGRTGFAPVRARHRAAASAERSICSEGADGARRRLSRSRPAQMWMVPP